MYLHEVQSTIDNGGAVRRESWPSGDRIVKVPGTECDLSDEEKEQCGLDADAAISIVDSLVYCEGSKKATVGYELTHEDKHSQDWSIV